MSFVPMDSVGERGGLKLNETRTVEEVYNGYTYFEDGDVVIAKITPCFENGKGALARELTNGVAFGTTELHVVRPGTEIDGRFLFYLTIADDFRSFGEAEMLGAGGQKRIPEDFVKDWRAPLPPFETQRRIADFLDEKTARINSLIEKKHALLERLAEKRQALLTRAVTKGLSSTARMKNSGIDWLGEIPDHWIVKPIYSFQRRITYGFTNPMPTTDDGPFMLTANDIDYGSIRYETARRTDQEAFDDDITDKSRPQLGDILITKDGTLGRVAVFDGQLACINQSVALLRVQDKLVDPDFLAFCLLSQPYQEEMILNAGGTTIKHIYITRLTKMPVAMPSISEQLEIRDYCRHISETISRVERRIQSSIERLSEYRSSIVISAVSGRIRRLL
ncbi:MAG: restriction endonuclease subunit S [Myxococcota bacterium]